MNTATASKKSYDSIRLFARSFNGMEKVNTCFCSFCAKAGLPYEDCFVSESELGGIDEGTGELICKYCLGLIARLRGRK